MKLAFGMILLTLSTASFAQAWKTLPKGVRILGYRNVTTSKINENFNQFRSESALGPSFRVDAATLDDITGGVIQGNLSREAYNNLVVGDYKVDANANAKVHGFGFGYGITDRVMFFTSVTFYQAEVKAKIKRESGNTYEQVARQCEARGCSSMDDAAASVLRNLPDVDEGTIQSVVTNYYGYKPIGTWYGNGYGDTEMGLMTRVIDRGTWGLMLYPGVVLPTGRQDDPDLLQDMGFGDGQYDLFGEMATGYVVNDHLSFGTTLRYTYQSPTNKELRVPTARDFTLSEQKGNFNVKYGDRLDFMVNSTFALNDWLSMTPVYRYMYQLPTAYTSDFSDANKYLTYNTDKQEHQVQLTTSISSIQPFLKKKFILPAQINMNVVQTIGGKNVPKMGRFEVELRMLF